MTHTVVQTGHSIKVIRFHHFMRREPCVIVCICGHRIELTPDATLPDPNAPLRDAWFAHRKAMGAGTARVEYRERDGFRFGNAPIPGTRGVGRKRPAA